MGLLSYLENKVRTGADSLVNGIRRDINLRINYEISRVRRRIVVEFISIMVLMLAVIFLALAAAYFLIEYFMLGKTIVFLIIGVIFLVIGIITRLIK